MLKNLFRFVTHKSFEYFILSVIILNSVIISLETISGLSQSMMQTLITIDLICIGVFVVEAICKLIYFRHRYFYSGWNIFDFTIVVISVLPFGHYFSVLRAFRILRALRLIVFVPSLKRVVNALVHAIPGLVSTALLLLLVFFIFAIMGVHLFAADFPQWFGNIGRALFSLFQIMTLESWSMGIARPIMEIHPYAWAYFVPFILISSFMLLNFIIGIVVDAIAHLKAVEKENFTQDKLDIVLEKLAKLENQLKNNGSSKL